MSDVNTFHKVHGVRVLIYHNDKLLIMRRAGLDKNDANLWDIPGGKIEPGESVYDAIKREVFEETGLSSVIISIKDLHGLITGDFDSTNKLVIAVYECESSMTDIKLNEEHSEYRWIDPEELPSYNPGRVLTALKSSLIE